MNKSWVLISMNMSRSLPSYLKTIESRIKLMASAPGIRISNAMLSFVTVFLRHQGEKSSGVWGSVGSSN